MIEFIFFGMLFVVLTCVVINQLQDESANEHHEREYNEAKAEREKDNGSS